MITAIALTLVLAAGACLCGLQRHLLFPGPKALAVLQSPHHRIQSVAIPVNGKVLQGYVAAPSAASGPRRGLLYFNGRRENPTSIFRALPQLPDHHVLCFFHDRLGPSWRKPGEKELMVDALAVLDWWVHEGGIPVEHISVAGRSLGTGFAVQVASSRPVRDLALVSPFDQLITAVRNRLPRFPRGWLKDKFDSRDHIGQVRCPCLLVVADEDATVPVESSRALFNAWEGNLTEFVVRNCGHRGVLRRPDVHRALADFLQARAFAPLEKPSSSLE